MKCLKEQVIRKKLCRTQMKATEQYFPVVLFIMLQKAILTYESG